MARLISLDINSDFGFFKKPEINQVYLTYTLPPKPLILGIFGAILGMKGLKEQYYEKKNFPEYYEKLKDFKIGIVPNDKKTNFPFNKMVNKYNTNNSYFYSLGNTFVSEQLMIRPSYKIYVYVDKNDNENFKELINLLENNQTFFMPYMGKNDFPLEINDFEEHVSFEEINKEKIDSISIDSIYIYNPNKKELYKAPRFIVFEGTPKLNNPKPEFDFYENVPTEYNENMLYDLETMRYTSKPVKKEEIALEKSKLIKLNNKVICVF